MNRRTIIGMAVVSLLSLAQASRADEPKISIGIVNSMVKHLSIGQKLVLRYDFVKLVKDFTGYDCNVSPCHQPLRAGEYLKNGDWHLSVLSGVEFAWAQSRDEKLKPLMVLTYKQPTCRAIMVVRAAGNSRSMLDLKGARAHLQPAVHCRLFADKMAGGPAKNFFGNCSMQCNVEKTLDDVLRGTIDVAVVDEAALEVYRSIHPGRHKNLHILACSESFPAFVLAYREGHLTQDMCNRLRQGMFKANTSVHGKSVMATFRISEFQPVPADFPEQLRTILAVYPAPEPAGISTVQVRR